MEVGKHLGKVAIIALMAFIGFTFFHIRDSAGLSVIILGTIAAVYGIGWFVRRSGGVSRMIGGGVELFSPQQIPDLGIAPPDFSQKPSLEQFDPNAALYNPEAYYQQFLNPANQSPYAELTEQSASQQAGLMPYQSPQGFASPFTNPQQFGGSQAVGELPPGGATSRLSQDTGSYDLSAVYRNAAFGQSSATSMAPLPPRTNMKQLLLGHGVSVDIATLCVNTLILEQAHRGRDSLLRLISEELARLQQPLLLIDTSDTYTTIVNEFPFGHIVMSPQPVRPVVNEGKQVTTFGISKNEALRLGQELLHNGWQVLFRFDSYESKVEAAEILTLILRGMDSWEAQRRSRNGVLHSFIVLTDAYRLFPDDPIHSVVNNAHAAQGFQREVVHLIHAQGAMGLHFILGTRKISGMDAEALAHIPSWFVKWPNEQEARHVAPYIQIPAPQIMSVPPDQVLVCDLRPESRGIFPFRPRESSSFHEETGMLQTTYAFPLLSSPTQETLPPFPQR